MPSTKGHTTNSERAALYMRVSSEEQRDAGTIQTQSDSLTRHAAACGLEVAEVYADDRVSGTIPLHERPEGRRRGRRASGPDHYRTRAPKASPCAPRRK